MKKTLRIIGVVIVLNHFMAASAVEVAPRISDREIIEALADLRGAIKVQEQKMDQQFKTVDQQFKTVDQQFKALEQKMDQQFKAQEQKIDQQFKTVDQQFKAVDQQFKAVDQQFKAVDRQLESINHQISTLSNMLFAQNTSLTNMVLTLFGAIISLIVALFGYIAWDRRTMVKPLQERMERMELELHRDLEIQHPEGSRITRFINALRDLAESDERVAVVLRAHALL